MKTSFFFPVRVYYEDTDAGGIVYHARYLHFAERARTEWLRSQNITHQQLLKENVALVVSQLECQYHAPAILDDELRISLTIEVLSACQANLIQHMLRQQQLLCELKVTIVAISHTHKKPVRWPLGLYQAWQKYL